MNKRKILVTNFRFPSEDDRAILSVPFAKAIQGRRHQF